MKTQNSGYTVLEALIFLAVSGLLFAAIYPTFVGRDNKIKFSNSVRELEAQLNDVINDVSTGVYPPNQSICRIIPAAPPGSNKISFVGGGGGSVNEAQGSREDCIFIGKAVSFNNITDPNPAINVFTVVGRSKDNSTGIIPTSLDAAYPTAAAPISASPGHIDLTETYETKWKVPVSKVIVLNGNDGALIGPQNQNYRTGALAIMTELSSSGLTSQTKSVRFYNVKNVSQGDINRDVARAINRNDLPVSEWGFPRNFLICMKDPNSSTDRYAAIKLGEGNSTTVRALFDNEIQRAFGGVNVCA